MTKVLHVGAGNLYGGIETQLLDLARMRSLCPEMQPSFALNFEGRLSAALRETGAPLHMLGAMQVSRPWTVMRAQWKFSAVLKREQFDVVLFHGTWSLALLGAVARRRRARVFLWFHGPIDGSTWDQRRAMRQLPDRILANSHYTAGCVQRFFSSLTADVLYYVSKPFDTSGVEQIRKTVRAEFAVPDDAAVVFQFCRLEEWKGHRILLQALEKLKTLPRWECWIAGGPQRPDEERYLDALKLEAARLQLGMRVRFLGQRADIPRLLAAADIMCQPNTGPEPFGLVFVEALSASKPVVTSAMGGGAEIVTAACGVLVQPGDADALAEALRKLILDETTRLELGRNGPARAKELCDPERALKRLYNLLSSDASARLN